MTTMQSILDNSTGSALDRGQSGLGSGGDTMKKCRRCEEIKSLSDFYFNKKHNTHSSYCKVCTKIIVREWQKQNHEKFIFRVKKWQVYNHDKHLKNIKKWQNKNREKIKLQKRRQRQNPKVKLHNAVGVAVNISLKGNKNGRAWEHLVGYSRNDLMKHLEKQFTPEMNWSNQGSYWHIDHIIPVSAFNFKSPDDYDFKRCWALKNLRPLEKEKNFLKSASLAKPFQPSLLIGA